MENLADFPTLYHTAKCLNDIAVNLQKRENYMLAHQTLKDAMFCMQLILRPDQFQACWPSKREMLLKLNIARERIRLSETPNGNLPFEVEAPEETNDPQVKHLANAQHPSLVDPISVNYEVLDQTGVDVNSAIIVFNFGLTYLGLASRSCPTRRKVLYEAAIELFYLSYSILVKLSVETEQLDFCEYILVLSMNMLRQTIQVNTFVGRDVKALQNLLRNAEDSFSVLHRIGRSTMAAAA